MHENIFSDKETNNTTNLEHNIEKIIDNYPLLLGEHFKLPISYIKNKQELTNNIIQDLELSSTIESNSSGVSVYQGTFTPSSQIAKIILTEFPKYYTHDVDYLKDTQMFLQKYSKNMLDSEYEPCDSSSVQSHVEPAVKIWKEIRGDTGFESKYHYIEWESWKYLNKYEYVLQFISMYSLAAPVLSLLVPLVVVIMPFFIIKARGLEVTMKEYIDILKVVAANHAICKIFTSFTSVSADQKIYLIMSTALYLFSIYQNFLACARFYKNMKKMHEDILMLRKYIDYTTDKMDFILQNCGHLKSYQDFVCKLTENKQGLLKCKEMLNTIYGDKLTIMNVGQIGRMMMCFYELRTSSEYEHLFLYSFGFHGFLENLYGLQHHINNKKLQYASFKKNKKTKFKDSYYGPHINKKHITNNISLDKNLIITGPNASGKTTTLKTALINIILSQQFGCGFYKEANINPYHHIHCYLNIPDTSARDSLFQAEARRCKEIIDCVQNYNNERHFCVFDELYSGTNPDEAVISATAFMKYLIKNKNVSCILTTHFLAICNTLDKNKRVRNQFMETKKTGKSLDYTYVIKDGISNIKGGIQVLKDMEYPDEILKDTE